MIKVFFVRGNHSPFHVCGVTQTTVHAQSSIPKIVTRYHVFNVLLKDGIFENKFNFNASENICSLISPPKICSDEFFSAQSLLNAMHILDMIIFIVEC